MSKNLFNRLPKEGNKAFSNELDPIKKYMIETSLRMSGPQSKLMESTLERIGHWSIMLGSPDQLQFLANLCRSIGAKKTLDIGTFTGYSALSIAMVLPEGGKCITCDVTDEFLVKADGAQIWKEAGVEKKIDFRIAPALDTLGSLIADGQENTFDFAFIDALKTEYREYYELCLRLLRPGGVIALDNMSWSKKVLNAEKLKDSNKPHDIDTCALAALSQFLKDDMRVDVSFLDLGDGTYLCFKK